MKILRWDNDPTALNSSAEQNYNRFIFDNDPSALGTDAEQGCYRFIFKSSIKVR